MVYDSDVNRVQMRYLGTAVDLEAVDVITNRIEFEPLKVLEAYGEMSGAYGTLIDLGFRIGGWDSVESDAEVARIAKAAYPRLQHISDDICTYRVVGKYHLLIGGLPCQPWSMANRNAREFEDPRSEVLWRLAGR